jgi:hypothetical protein
MTPKNSYSTLQEFKNYFTARNGTAIPADTVDDGVLEQLLENASRYIDSKTGRWFYPRIETRYYDIPDYPYDGRDIYLDADLFEILTFSNGDGVSIASTQYNLKPKNETPKFQICMKETSNVVWSTDSDGESEGVLDLLAIWGYHNRYINAWKVGSTLAEALDTSETEWDVTSAALFSPGQIVKVDNELGIVSTAPTGKVNVVQRGDNGSTAATHDNGATVYIWQPMDDARNAVLEIANQAKARRFGQSLSNTETVTAGGIVISPRDVPAMAAEFIKTYQRRG